VKWLLVVAMLAAVTACGTGDASSETTIRVFAAASLTESFTELGRVFEEDHPDAKVELNFGPSSGLAEQIDSGAPADVFASASPTNMDAAVEAGHAKDPEDFATSSMEIAVPVENRARIDSLDDLARKGVKVALCQAQVPCGKVAAEVFAKAGLTVRPATEEADVKSVLTKVTLGEVDAGMVYVTDVLAAGDDVVGIEIPDDQNASTTYPIATLTHSEHTEVADQFVDLVLSETGVKVLRAAGFRTP
jgi:molybdate transport system substrate-binding protein